MRPLPAPAIVVSDVLADCITDAEAALQPRLGAIVADMVARETTYVHAAKSTALHTLPTLSPMGAVTLDELNSLYSNHMSATSGSARRHYDQIRNAAPNKRCPLCGAGTVATLDHHLPKSKYPDLAILPINLVPACHHCNDSKKARYPKSAGEQTLHPYFDGHLQGQWLTASVDQGPPVTVIYDVVTPPGWTSIDGQRAKRHFTICKLDINYASNAGDELGPIREQLLPLWTIGGPGAVQAHLAGQAQGHGLRPNSWQHALYQALSNDEWFYNGGFHHIAQ